MRWYNPRVPSIRARFAHRLLYLRLLRASLAAGALYNLGFAGSLATAPAAASRRLGLTPPAEPVLPAVLAVTFTLLAALYLVAARDPRRYSAVVAVAIAGRLAGAVVLAAAAGLHPQLANLYPAAAVELTLGLAHAAFWYPVHA
jgi:hypothetical protein